uniref:SGS-II n=1 Tax=Griffonia simplicifolia TaxID=3850 RepID=O22595_GRISI|nr:sGS-II [Griffonia simplicifolia]
MATKTQALILLFSLFTISCSFIKPCHADCVSKEGVAVIWGQRSESEEKTLQETCATGNYKIILLDYLIVYENGTEPLLNLASHCGWAGNLCSKLESEIKYCQSNGIQVLISLWEDRPNAATPTRSALKADAPAEKLADYLWNNYLSGQSGPLGAVALDGINIIEAHEDQKLHWDEIVKAVSELSKQRKVYIGATPQCVDPYLEDAIATGLVDYAFVEFFYDPQCEYDSTNKDPTKLVNSWNKWISKDGLTDKQVFLGIPANKEVTGAGGYIDPEDLKRDVLPVVQKASNYGGIMLYDRAADVKNGYSDSVKDYVPTACKCVCDDSFPFYNQALAL